MKSKFLLPSLGALAALFSACAPLIPYQGPLRAAPGPDPQKPPVGTEEQRAVEEARKEAARKAAAEDPAPPKRETVPKPNTPTGKPDYPRAVMIPGKEGYVFNPFTNNPVDVRGIPSGTLVKDPQDPDGDNHKFRVP